MKTIHQKNHVMLTTALTILSTVCCGNAFAADTGKLYGDFRLRLETVNQENALKNATALTLRSRLGYKTKTVNGLSAVIEIEDARALEDEYAVPPSGFNRGVYSVVADPESHTEVDQAFINYKGDKFYGKLGRQVITLDNHRFVGHVGWRQDRQTFDALSAGYSFKKGTVLKYAYLDKRNRIFSEDADIESKDHLLNFSTKTSAGKLGAYAYLLEVDNGTENSLDTYGVSLSGGKKLSYKAEFATQDSTAGGTEYSTDYLNLEGGFKVGSAKVKIGYEKLGSDNGLASFATPLATLHKFNGWADQFLGTPKQGLEDIYVSVGGKYAGAKWLVAYHTYSSEESLGGSTDLGSELNLLLAKKFTKRYSGGIKTAFYDAGDSGFGKVDTDKVWLWAGAKF